MAVSEANWLVFKNELLVFPFGCKSHLNDDHRLNPMFSAPLSLSTVPDLLGW